MNPTQKVTSTDDAKIPQTTFQLLFYILKNFIKNIPKLGLSMLIRSAIIFIAIMLFNIYMVADVNEGFVISVAETSPSYDLINVGTNKMAFTTLCFLVVYVVSTIFAQFKQRGIKPFLKDIVTTPVWTLHCLSKSDITFYAFFIGFGLTSLLGIYYKNTYVYLMLVIGIFVSYSSQDRGMNVFVGNILWSDIQRIFVKKKERKTLNPASLGVGLFAVLLGLLILIVVPDKFKTLFGILVPIICFGSIIAVRYKLMNKKTALYLLFFGTLNLLYYAYSGTVFADDGGKDEMGGNWLQYPSSPGASQVIKSGVTPGVLGVLGGMASSALSSMWGAVSSVGSTIKYGADIAIDTVVGSVGTVKDAVVFVATNPGYIKDVAVDTVVGTVKQIKDTVVHVGSRAWDEVSEVTSDLYDGISELSSNQALWDGWFDCMWEDMSQMGTSLSETADSAWNTVSDLGSNVYDVLTDADARSDFWEGFTDDIGYGLSTSADWVTDGLVNIWNNPSSIADGLSSAYDTTGNILEAIWNTVSNTVNDPEKVYQTIKDMVGADNFSNSWDPNRSGWDRVGQSLWGTFELGGAVFGARDAVQGGVNYVKNGLATRADNQLINSIDNIAGSYGDDVSRNLGSRGSYIHEAPIDPNTMTGTSKNILRDIARENNVQIHVRPGNLDSVKWIDESLAVPKPPTIKIKTLDDIDAILGGPKNSSGLVGYYNPTNPRNIEGFSNYSDDVQRAIIKRYNKRIEEIADYGKDMQRMVDRGEIKVVDGLIVDSRSNRWIAGDNDIYDITKLDGTPLDYATARRIEDQMINTTGAGVEHRSLTEWNPLDPSYNQAARDRMIDAGRTGNQGLISINPDGTITRSFVKTGVHATPVQGNLWATTYGGVEGANLGQAALSSQ